MYTIYIKLYIIHTNEPVQMFRREIAIICDTLLKRNIKLIHKIYIHNVESL